MPSIAHIHLEILMKLLALIACLAFVPLMARSQQTVTEPSTEKKFPAEVTFKNGETSYTVSVTGVAVRKKVIIKVYGMAHYMQNPVRATRKDAFAAILTDGKAKQISMEFVRDVDLGKIQEAYHDGFKSNCSAEDFAKIEPLVNKFVGYFTKDVKENDQFVLRWLPGNTIVAIVQGEEKPPIVDATFAKTLWSIWFGEDSIVDRDDLVSRIAE